MVTIIEYVGGEKEVRCDITKIFVNYKSVILSKMYQGETVLNINEIDSIAVDGNIIYDLGDTFAEGYGEE